MRSDLLFEMPPSDAIIVNQKTLFENNPANGHTATFSGNNARPTADSTQTRWHQAPALCLARFAPRRALHAEKRPGDGPALGVVSRPGLEPGTAGSSNPTRISRRLYSEGYVLVG